MASFYLAVVTTVVFFWCLAVFSGDAVLFSSLEKTLVVSASPRAGAVLVAGTEKLNVTWGPNMNLTSKIDGDDKRYAKVKVELCYAPESQTDRGWRKTKDDLTKDKTCQFEITEQPYSADEQTYEYLVGKEIPSATYFIRAYVLDADGDEVAYGQTTDEAKTKNLFIVHGITGHHTSITIAATCFSAFAVVSFGILYKVEKRKMM